jgi:glycosyltransferase involved in cell wall biosynthesis
MAADPGAVLLDLTRLVSRLGRGPQTGIDRVEFAYLQMVLARGGPVFALVRTGFGYVILDRVGMAGLAARITGAVPLGRADVLGRLAHRRDRVRAQAEADVRRLAVARAVGLSLRRMIVRYLPDGGRYFNTGHANLSDAAMRAVRTAGLRIVVLVHDTIPLDHPEYCRPDTIEGFRGKMRVVARQADLVVHTSRDARDKTEAQFAAMGRVPLGVVANLGVPVPVADGAVSGVAPYFVVLGTIEPRKNHALLLDLWERLGPDAPMLYILGARGWSNTAVFARLNALGPGARVCEMPGLEDAAVAGFLLRAQGLLFPSHAEGFGLPAVEAAALGTPVISADLAVVRELVGDNAVYLDVTDSYSWMETILRLSKASEPGSQQDRRFEPPTWAAHFKIVLSHA